MNNFRRIQQLPAYLLLITANALPVYGAVLGKLVFFQVLYLYWLESLLLILFDLIRIACARGQELAVSMPKAYLQLQRVNPAYDLSFAGKLRMVLGSLLVRTGLLLFYLLFIMVFIGFQLTDKGQRHAVLESVLLQSDFMQLAIWAFVISQIVQLAASFFLNKEYQRMSPRNYLNYFSGRVILMHVMIVGSVFLHSFLFEGKTYAAKGEIVYIGLFMLLKTIMDLVSLSRRLREEPGMVMI